MGRIQIGVSLRQYKQNDLIIENFLFLKIFNNLFTLLSAQSSQAIHNLNALYSETERAQKLQNKAEQEESLGRTPAHAAEKVELVIQKNSHMEILKKQRKSLG